MGVYFQIETTNPATPPSTYWIFYPTSTGWKAKDYNGNVYSYITTTVSGTLLLVEQGSTPATPPATDWLVYTKSDGLYLLEDNGNVYNILNILGTYHKMQGSDPAAPPASTWRIYPKSDGWYVEDSSGNVYNLVNTLGTYQKVQGSNPAAPPASTWRLFPKADGWYAENSSGTVYSINMSPGKDTLTLLEQGSPPATPAASNWVFYAESDGPHIMNSAGTVFKVNYGGSGASDGFNLLMNGSFRIWQRGTSITIQDDQYGADRWYVLTQSASANSAVFSRQTGNTLRYCGRVLQNVAAANRLGMAQIIEGRNCFHLRGKKSTLSGRIRLSTSDNVRFAILSWTGTEDSVTSDVVNSWTSTNYTAGNFFNATTLTVEGVGVKACTANVWTTFSLTTTANMSSSLTNVIVFIWTENTVSQNATLDCEAIQLEMGDNVSAFDLVSEGQENLNCYRYLYRFQAQSAYTYFSAQCWCDHVSTFTEWSIIISLPVPMRIFSPTISSSDTSSTFLMRNTNESISNLSKVAWYAVLSVGVTVSFNAQTTTVVSDPTALWMFGDNGGQGTRAFVQFDAEL